MTNSSCITKHQLLFNYDGESNAVIAADTGFHDRPV